MGTPGVSPFSYVDPVAKSDIYYNGGNVGIGTIAPQKKVHIVGSNRDFLRLDGSASFTQAFIEYNCGDTTWQVGNHDLFSNYNGWGIMNVANSAAAFNITPVGNVGIGTTNPSTWLHVKGGGPGSVFARGIRVDEPQAPTTEYGIMNMSGSEFVFISTTETGNSYGRYVFASSNDGVNTVVRMVIGQDGKVGIGTGVPMSMLDVAGDIHASGTITSDGQFGPSDVRLKTDIEPLGPSLTKLLQLRGVTFKWREPDKHGYRAGAQVGMIAQEVEKVFPDWVVTGSDGYKAVGYTGFEALTIESLRELKKGNDRVAIENDRLKAENSELKSKLALIEERLSAIEKRIAGESRLKRSGGGSLP